MAVMALRRAVLGLSILGLVAAGCSRGAEPAGPGGGPPARNATTAELLPTAVGTLPAFDLERYEKLLGQLRGTPVLVNVWGSWCGPCRSEMPDLVAAHGRYGDRVQFLGVDILDSRASARAFQSEFAMRFPSVFDPAGAIRDGLGLLGQPVTLFYDARGELASTWTGPIPPDELRDRIEHLLAT
jgi:cytochrome c biogenesis protein CcmG/thiol:disulfide interchange protein DsbE